MKGRRLAALVTALLASTLLSPVTASAMEIRASDAVVVGQDVDDDLYAFGETVEVAGDVTGDVIAFAQSVTITGRVSGDVIAAGGSVLVSGPVGGTVRVAGSDVTVEDPIADDLIAAGATVRVTKEADIERDAAIAGGIVSLGGDVGGDLLAGARSLTISSDVGGDVTAEVDRLRLTQYGSIGGDLTYRSAWRADLQGEVTGKSERLPPQDDRPMVDPTGDQLSAVSAFFAGALVWVRGLIGLSVLVVVLALSAGRYLEAGASVIAERPWPSLGVGFAVLALAAPVAVLVALLGLVIGGWWLAVVLLAVVWLLALAGLVVGSLELGRIIARRGWPDRDLSAYQAGLLGLVAIWVFAVVPLVGWLAVPAATLLGTGSIVLATWWPSVVQKGEAPEGGELAAGRAKQE